MKKYLLLSIMLLLFLTGCFSSKSVKTKEEANNIEVSEIKEQEESSDSDDTEEDEIEVEIAESTVSVDKEIKKEHSDYYYKYIDNEETAVKILKEFSIITY